jgi:hypothetical protein
MSIPKMPAASLRPFARLFLFGAWFLLALTIVLPFLLVQSFGVDLGGDDPGPVWVPILALWLAFVVAAAACVGMFDAYSAWRAGQPIDRVTLVVSVLSLALFITAFIWIRA